MQLDELEERLVPFCRAMYEDDQAFLSDVHDMPGHAGFAYGFTVHFKGRQESWFLRMPPPNVKWRGTADVLRQVAALDALEGTNVPHCSVKWSGDDLQWFGRPYFIVPQLHGDVLRLGRDEWGSSLSDETLYKIGKRAVSALAEIHQVDWAKKAPYLGPPLSFEEDIARWDFFYGRFADPERLARLPEVRRKLLDCQPADSRIGIFHGDFQTANFFCSFKGELLAIIDWELVGVGATLNDMGWLVTFSDPQAWSAEDQRRTFFLDPDTLIDFYTKASGGAVHELNWFRALAAYKFSIITGFNLGLHRRGKRPDPLWEQVGLSMSNLVERALELLG